MATKQPGVVSDSSQGGGDRDPRNALACRLRPLPLAPPPPLPLVSVVVANYNYGRYLGEAIESVQAQTYDRIEMVICDDGSTDDSCAIVERYAGRDRRIRLIRRENRGQAAATETAFSAATGDIVCLLDADDRFLEGKVAAVVAAFAHEPAAGACIHRILPVSTAGAPISDPIPPVLEGGWVGPQIARTGLLGTPLSTSGIALRREVAALGFPLPDETFAAYRRSAPVDMYLLGIARLTAPVVALPDALAEYRFHGGNDGLASAPTDRSISQILGHCESIHAALSTFVERRYGPGAAAAAPLIASTTYAEHLLAYALVGPRCEQIRGFTIADALARLPNTRRKQMWRMLLALPQPVGAAALRAWWGMSPWKRFVRPAWRLLRVGAHGDAARQAGRGE